jgi:muramoyltetrapeptide carboxypeptidase
MATQLGEDPEALRRLRALLFGEEPGPLSWEPLPVAGGQSAGPAGTAGPEGPVEGPLHGGNLALLASLCGTQLQPSYRGCLVLLEDLGEPPYRLDRLLTQLLLSGAFEGVAGFVVGDLTGPGEDPRGRAEVVAERLAPLGAPIAFGAPFGHAGRNQPVAFGCAHRLDAGRGLLVPLEAPTAARQPGPAKPLA